MSSSLKHTLAAAAAALAMAAPLGAAQAQGQHKAQGQGTVAYDWGGGQEWGGNRQTVSLPGNFKAGQIIVSFGDRRLYLVTKPGQAVSYPIAIPKDEARWQGATSVSQKRENPSWTPTPDMLRKNPRLPPWVPGGHPMNPLGIRALYLGSSTYRIHGTDAPWTIGQAASAGCIRMHNQDVLDLYPRVPVGTQVTVTWQRYKTAPSAEQVAAETETKAKPEPQRRTVHKYSRYGSRTAQVE